MRIFKSLKDWIRSKSKDTRIEDEYFRLQSEPIEPTNLVDDVPIPIELVASARQFIREQTSGQLSNILLWMLSYNYMREQASLGSKPPVEASALISRADLRAWFGVSVCIGANMAFGELDRLVGATEELGLEWEKDVSWRLRRLILLYDEKGEFPAPGFRGLDRSKEKVERMWLKFLKMDLYNLLRVVRALQPEGGDYVEESWSDVKIRLIRKIQDCLGLRSKALEVPFDLLVFTSARPTWYHSKIGVDFECRDKILKFLRYGQGQTRRISQSHRISQNLMISSNAVEEPIRRAQGAPSWNSLVKSNTIPSGSLRSSDIPPSLLYERMREDSLSAEPAAPLLNRNPPPPWDANALQVAQHSSNGRPRLNRAQSLRDRRRTFADEYRLSTWAHTRKSKVDQQIEAEETAVRSGIAPSRGFLDAFGDESPLWHGHLRR
ncbi:hypothetical protein IWX49DRAFT_571972 [Phyllosticta citricarpa]